MNIIETYKEMFDAFLHPQDAKKNLRKKTPSDAAIAVILGALIPALLGALALFALGSVFGAAAGLVTPGFGLAGLGAGLGVAAGIAAIILYPVGQLISWLIGAILIWVVAKILGGKGDLMDFAVPFAFPFAAMTAISWIPIVGLLVSIWMLYVLYQLLQTVMGLESGKAILAIILLVVVAFVAGGLLGTIFTLGALTA